MTTNIEELLLENELGVLTPDDLKVLDRHYEQVFRSTTFLHQSASTTTPGA